MNRVAAFFEHFDADDFFSFTTPRVVRIKDRRLGILSYSFKAVIAIYIVVYVIIYQKSYQLKTVVKGLTRLDIFPPPPSVMNESLDVLPYCDSTLGVNDTATYQTSVMPGPWDKLSCLRHGSRSFGGIIYPRDEVSAMFVVTKARKSRQTYPSACDPEVAANCGVPDLVQTSVQYVANPELYLIYFLHTMDVREFDVFLDQSGLKSNGLIDKKGNKVDLCKPYERRNLPCSPDVGTGKSFDHIPIESLLEAAGVDGATLDATSNTMKVQGDDGFGATFRSEGMILLIEIVYEGTVSISGSANLVSYSFFASYIPRSGYIQYQYKEVTPSTGGSAEVWEETLLTGIRMSVRQSGNLGRFNFQVFLLSLVSSVALLAASSAVVKFLAFYVLPNRFIYHQYAAATSVDFSDLTPEQRALFQKHDLVNPPPDPAKFLREFNEKKAREEGAAATEDLDVAGSGSVGLISSPPHSNTRKVTPTV